MNVSIVVWLIDSRGNVSTQMLLDRGGGGIKLSIDISHSLDLLSASVCTLPSHTSSPNMQNKAEQDRNQDATVYLVSYPNRGAEESLQVRGTWMNELRMR